MSSRKHLTAPEAAILDAALPPGLTDDMRDVAFCLFEALALADSRAGSPTPGKEWAVVLQAMARTATMQLRHLARQKGGKAIYLAKGVAFDLTMRDREMCAKFRGDYEILAREYGLTPMRVRQVVDTWQYEQFVARQGRLPGIDADIS